MWASKYIKGIKENGIKQTLVLFYQLKLDSYMQKLLTIIYKRFPLKDFIVIMSHDDFDCNGGAFYDYLIKKGYNEKYKIVWIIRHKAPNMLPKNVYAFKYFRPSIVKDYYISRAKILISEDFIIGKVRKDQKAYYFTHGHGGFAIKNVVGKIVIPDTIDYCLVSSHHLDEIESKAWSMPYPNNKMLNLGFPSNDVLFAPDLKTSHIIKKDEFDLTILWMPTFRKLWVGRNDSSRDYEYGIPLIESAELMAALKRYLAEKNYCLIIKIHPMQAKETYIKLKQEENRNLIVLDGSDVKAKSITNQQLYVLADLMISDYSTAVFPFMLLNKPIGFVLSDLSDYSIGLSMEAEDVMVGYKIYSYDNFIRFVDDAAGKKDIFYKKRTETVKYLYDYIDGNSCERIVQHMGL